MLNIGMHRGQYSRTADQFAIFDKKPSKRYFVRELGA